MWQTAYMFDLGLIIGGGSAQIQKNIISERGLEMPREPKVAKNRIAPMYFGLSEDQIMLQDSVRRFLKPNPSLSMCASMPKAMTRWPPVTKRVDGIGRAVGSHTGSARRARYGRA